MAPEYLALLMGSNCWTISLFHYPVEKTWYLPFVGDILVRKRCLLGTWICLVDEKFVRRAVCLPVTVQQNAINATEKVCPRQLINAAIWRPLL